MIQKVEFIESYIRLDNGDYQWNDNHGELVRCKDCRYYNEEDHDCNITSGYFHVEGDWFCADGERNEE